MKQEFGQVYGPTCRADLGDSRCSIDLALHVQTAVITAVLGQDSFTLAPALATTKPIPGGKVGFTSGANTGIALEIRGYDGGGTQTLGLFVPPPFQLAVGDGFQVYPACDKRFSTCRTVWNNARNFRGEPHLPGRDFLLTGEEGGGRPPEPRWQFRAPL